MQLIWGQLLALWIITQVVKKIFSVRNKKELLFIKIPEFPFIFNQFSSQLVVVPVLGLAVTFRHQSHCT